MSGPYLHDGAARTLRVAIFRHDAAAEALSRDEVARIEAFLRSLTDRRFVSDERFALPTAFCGKARIR